MKNTKQTAVLGIFTGIVVVLQLLGSFIRLGTFSISLVWIPIVLGAVLYGPLAGGWLGLVFSIIVLIMDSGIFMAINPPATILIVLVKGIVGGLAAGLVYQLVKGYNRYVGVIAAAIAGGLATAAILAPVSGLAALILVPLAASASAIFAGISIAWRGAHEDTDRHGGDIGAVSRRRRDHGRSDPVARPA